MIYNFTSNFSNDMYRFLELKESLNFSPNSYDWGLNSIDTYAKTYFPNETELTKAFVESWIKNCRSNITQNGQRGRVTIIRDFSRYLKLKGHDSYVIDASLVPKSQSYIPHLFTDNELKQFFRAADTLPAKKNKSNIIAPVLFRMMYCCAMRPNEPLALLRNDVDLINGIIIIKNSKRHTDRIIQLTEELVTYLKEYDESVGNREFFFSSQSNGQLKIGWSYNIFETCWVKAGLGSRNTAPRPYDFRHSSSSRVILKWIQEDKDIMAMLPYLQTHLGHKNLKDTLYYIHLLPEHIFDSQKIDLTDFNQIYPEIKNEKTKR